VSGPSQLVRRAAAGFSLGALEAIRDRPGNPRGIAIRRFGGAVATASAAEPELDFLNWLLLLDPPDAARVGAITDFYRAVGSRGWTEVTPAPGIEPVLVALAEHGWRQVGFHAAFVGPAEVAGPAPPGVIVRAAGPDDLDAFGAAMARGHGVPAATRPEAGRDFAAWGARGWPLALAEVEGELAGAAALVVDGEAGFLANAATVSRWRRRGVQTALIRHRIALARAAGCRRVCALAQVGSGSQRNLERAGLALVHTQSVLRMF
jgi:GNAT superfamily N-acetyltransferase